MRDSIGLEAAAKWILGYVTVVIIAGWIQIGFWHRAGATSYSGGIRLLGRFDRPLAQLLAAILTLVSTLIFPLERLALQSGGLCGFATLAVWWRMQPMYLSLELFARGMILNRFRFRPWSDVLDYGWVGGVPTELSNCFKHNTVDIRRSMLPTTIRSTERSNGMSKVTFDLRNEPARSAAGDVRHRDTPAVHGQIAATSISPRGWPSRINKRIEAESLRQALLESTKPLDRKSAPPKARSRGESPGTSALGRRSTSSAFRSGDAIRLSHRRGQPRRRSGRPP